MVLGMTKQTFFGRIRGCLSNDIFKTIEAAYTRSLY